MTENPAMAQTLTSIIETPTGPIQGFNKGQVQRFTGIPYAEASRFKPPVAVSPWTATLAATSPSPACPQPPDPVARLFLDHSLAYGHLPYDEKCQFLSITRPASIETSSKERKLHVMVWFYGGSFINGAADTPIYDPSRLVAETEVIVVNVGSRLSIFGYLGDENDDHDGQRPCNLGLLDCLAALWWIQKNISSFGGNPDPKTITIFGQSAGGSTVGDLLVTQDAASLFGRVIMQSAPLGITRNRSAMNKVLFSVVKDITSETPTQEIVARIEKVMAASRRFGISGGMAFAPQYGFDPLPAEDDLETQFRVAAKEIEILIGSTADEASMFIPFIPVVSTLTNLPIIGNAVNRRVTAYITRRLYFDAQRLWYDTYAAAGGKITEYEVTWKKHNRREQMGATHGIELPLLFCDEEALTTGDLLKNRDFGVTQADGEKLRHLWADFAKGRHITKEDGLEDIIKILRSSPGTESRITSSIVRSPSRDSRVVVM